MSSSIFPRLPGRAITVELVARAGGIADYTPVVRILRHVAIREIDQLGVAAHEEQREHVFRGTGAVHGVERDGLAKLRS